jgi:hypothetical protein
MGQFIQVNGDYNIKTGEGQSITLDTGPGVGLVRVTGNLVVDGDTTTVSAENLNVKDNIITVNFGETGAGVTLRYAGIEVDRGTEASNRLVFDEDDDSWNILAAGGFAESQLRLRKILTNADTDSGDLTLIGEGLGVVKVLGTTTGIDRANAYETRVTDPDDIPNKAYVDNAIQTSPTFQFVRDDTRAVAFDLDNPIDVGLFPVGPYFSQPSESQVAVIVDDSLSAVFFKNRARIGGLVFYSEEPTPFNPLLPDASVIQTLDTNANIKLETNGTGKVEITYALQLNNHGVTPAEVANTSLLYGGPVDSGTTGVYYTNEETTDELIGKNKALVYSMIF